MTFKRLRKSKLFLSISTLLFILAIPTVPVLAHNYYGSGYYGECLYSSPSTSCDISISNNSFTLSLPVQPTPNGLCTIQSDQISVSTYDPSGYTLTLDNTSTSTGLLNGSNSIPASAGTPSSPQALANTWGYRVDGLSGFGSGPTSAETNAAINNSITFAGAKSSSLTADTIAQTSSVPTPYLPVSTTVWYGVCANTTLAIPQGSYQATVLYTATAN
jgi:hypothetical protein